MPKYIVRVFILKMGEKGKSNSEDFEYEFVENSLMEARNKAISKTKDLLSLFEHEMPEQSKFSTFNEAEIKGFEGYNAFTIELFFVLDDGDFEYPIYGDVELIFESLEVESDYYLKNFDNTKFIKMKNADGETIEILEENSEFFIKYVQGNIEPKYVDDNDESYNFYDVLNEADEAKYKARGKSHKEFINMIRYFPDRIARYNEVHGTNYTPLEPTEFIPDLD